MKKIWYLCGLFLLNNEIVSWFVVSVLVGAFLWWLLSGAIKEKEKKDVRD